MKILKFAIVILLTSGVANSQRLATHSAEIEEEFCGNSESEFLDYRELSSVKSYWNHNGSVVGLIPEGRNRTFIYVKPRSGLQGLVEPGMVLFSGISDNSSYNGIARRFRKGLPPIKYNVSGPINKGGSQVVLTGEVTTRNADGSPKETILDKLVFDLK